MSPLSNSAVQPVSIVEEHNALSRVAAEVTGGAALQSIGDDQLVLLRSGDKQYVEQQDPDWKAILANLPEQLPAFDASGGAVAEMLGPWDTGYITFSGGTPVGGYSQLTLHRNGAYNFSGHFHVSGAPSYNTGLAFAVRSGNGTVYTFAHRGRVHGTFEAGSRDDDWGDSGVNPALAAGWVDLSNWWSYHWNAAVNIDIGSLIGSAVQAVGWAATVIAIVA
jgi:hypothetical protein